MATPWGHLQAAVLSWPSSPPRTSPWPNEAKLLLLSGCCSNQPRKRAPDPFGLRRPPLPARPRPSTPNRLPYVATAAPHCARGSESPRTLEAYRFWIARFQAFVRSRPTADLGTQEVRGFLSDLAVREHVAASTQNQAFNALLFFYRHVLHRGFGQVDGVVRAKHHRYVPVVLSHTETEAVLGELQPPSQARGQGLGWSGRAGGPASRCAESVDGWTCPP